MIRAKRYVIVGAGVAGVRAAETIRAHDDGAEIFLLTAEETSFYRKPQLGDFVRGKLSASSLLGRSSSFYQERRIELRLGTKVVRLDPDAQAVLTASGETLEYDKLVVATGKVPAPTLAVGGVWGLGTGAVPGVVSFTTLADAEAVRAVRESSGIVVVLGDSLPAVQMAYAAVGPGVSVTYLSQGDRILPQCLDEDAAALVEQRLRAAGVDVVHGVEAERVLVEAGRATGLKAKDGRVFRADLVGLCAEFRPAVEFLPVEAGSLHVGEDLSTPWPHVFAAGDVVGDEPPFNWLRAWRQGEVAGLASCGVATPGVGRAAVHVLNSQLGGLSVVAIGQTVVPYRSGLIELRSDVVGEVYKKLVFASDDRLIGALLVGNVAEAGALEEAIRLGVQRRDLDPGLLKQLFEPTLRPRYLGVHCPVCRHEIQLDRGARPGDRITCPVCGVELVLVERAQGIGAEVLPA